MQVNLQLYDALLAANVPPDKAKCVVEALEKDMVDMLATKADLQLLEQRITIKLGAMLVIMVGALAAIIKL